MEKFPQINNVSESREDELKILEKETGINESILKKIASNSKLRKTFITLAATIGFGLMHNEVNAQTKEKFPTENSQSVDDKKMSREDSTFLKSLTSEDNWVEVEGKNPENTQTMEDKEYGTDLLKTVTVKELKNILKEYETFPGDMPLDVLLEHKEDYTFRLLKPTVGNTFTGANFAALEELKLSGLDRRSHVITYSRKLNQNNIEVLKVIATKNIEAQ